VKVKAVTAMVCQGVSRAKGQTFSVPQAVAEQLFSAGLAEKVEAQPKDAGDTVASAGETSTTVQATPVADPVVTDDETHLPGTTTVQPPESVTESVATGTSEATESESPTSEVAPVTGNVDEAGSTKS